MKILLDIQDSKAGSFLNFIRGLDFITVKSAETTEESFEKLPQELQDILLRSEKDIESGHLFSHEEIMRTL